MKKLESTFINMFLALLGVTLISSTALAFVYKKTKDPIDKAMEDAKKAAIEKVVPAFDNNPITESYKIASDLDSLTVYTAKQGEQVIGFAVETYTKKAFNGIFKIMVGFLPDGTINDISVLEASETPGLGDKIKKEKSLDKNTGLSWSSQFNGKNPESFKLIVKKDGGDVDAITAATISSRAFCDALSRGYNALKQADKIGNTANKPE
ncbi:MAG: RnfABCDGE type electron transport complex subunit G [Bacteroidales bacterium]|nr:RnfABCDGE type electron transport complex subunit G [Bacteroidales bacterium]